MGAPSQHYVDPGSGSNSNGGTSDGDAWATIQYALDNAGRDATNGDQINVKAGTGDVLTGALSLATYGTPSQAAPLIIRGYTSTADDGGIGEIDGDGSYEIFASNYQYVQLFDLYCHNTGSNFGIDLGNNCSAFNVRVANTTGGAILFNDYGRIIGCSAENITLNASSHYVFECVNYGKIAKNKIKVTATNDSNGISAWNDTSVEDNVIHQTNGGMFNGIKTRRTSHCQRNSLYSTAGTGKGIWLNGTLSGDALVTGNIVEGFSGTGGCGIKIDSSSHVPIVAGNFYYNNATHESFSADVSYHEDNTTLGASVFNAPGSSDFQLKDDANTNNAGWPAYIGDQNQSVNDQNHAFPGALQRLVSGGGGTTVHVVNRIMKLLRVDRSIRKRSSVIVSSGGGGSTQYVPIPARKRTLVIPVTQKQNRPQPIGTGGGGSTQYVPIPGRTRTQIVNRANRRICPIPISVGGGSTQYVPILQRRNRNLVRDVFRRQAAVTYPVTTETQVIVPVHRKPRVYHQHYPRKIREIGSVSTNVVNQTVIVSSPRKVR